MLRDIRALPDVAVIEVAQHSLALDVQVGVVKLKVAFLLQAADGDLRPVSTTLMRVAGRVHGLLVSLSGCVRGRGGDVDEIAAGLRVLHVISYEADRHTRMPGIDVNAGKAVKQPELGGKLRVGDRADSRWIGCTVHRDDCCRGCG